MTVLMSVYNGEKYLPEAIQSILHQTFTDFEFLIIDDGSVDQSISIIRNYKDCRIRLERNEVNQGLVTTLNNGINMAQSEYIARMDCDDISLPERLAKQVVFMDLNPDIGICGTWFEYFGDRSLVMKFPEYDADIKREFLFHNCMGHPTIIMRPEIMKSNGIFFDYNFTHTEDYDLWTRLAKVTNFHNIPEVLYKYRIHKEQTSYKFAEQQRICSKIIQARLRKSIDTVQPLFW